MFAGGRKRIILYRRRGPGQIAVGVYLGIIVQSELQFFVTLQQFRGALLILRPTAVLDGGDIEEVVNALIVVLGYLGRIEGTPSVQQLLQENFVGSGRGTTFFLGFLAKPEALSANTQTKTTRTRLYIDVSSDKAKNCRTGETKAQRMAGS